MLLSPCSSIGIALPITALVERNECLRTGIAQWQPYFKLIEINGEALKEPLNRVTLCPLETPLGDGILLKMLLSDCDVCGLVR